MARILGIDIGGDALRGAVVRTAMRRVELERTIQVPLAHRPDSPGRLVEVTEAAQGLLRALGHPPDAVVASMSGEFASLRVVEFPGSAAKRVGEILPFELETLLPFDPKDAVIDHQPIDTRDGTLRVLAAAAPRERVRATLASFAEVGLDPHELAVGAAALEGLVPLLPDLGSGAVLIVELGEEHTDLCLLERGRGTLARTLSLGARSLPTAAADLSQEIKRTLAAHRAAGGPAPDRAVVCGVGSRISGVTPWLARELGCSVDALPLPAPEGGGAPEAVFGRAAALAARGAQIGRRIDLRRGEFVRVRATGRLVDHIQLAATCVVVVVMAATFSLKAQQSLLANERTALRSRLSQVTTEVFGTAATDPERVEVMVKSRESGDPVPRFDAFDALAAISAAVPEDIDHEVRRLRVDIADEKREGTVELQGTVSTIEQRDAIVTMLAKHECFKDIEPGRVTPAGGQDRINYQLEAALRCPGDEAPSKTKKRGGEP